MPRSTLASEYRAISLMSWPRTIRSCSLLSTWRSDSSISSLYSSDSEMGSGAKNAHSSSSRAAAGDCRRQPVERHPPGRGRLAVG